MFWEFPPVSRFVFISYICVFLRIMGNFWVVFTSVMVDFFYAPINVIDLVSETLVITLSVGSFLV
jgi:hypothetical protein